MDQNERQAYFNAIRSRYWPVGKKAKVTNLDEFCAMCVYHLELTLLEIFFEEMQSHSYYAQLVGLMLTTMWPKHYRVLVCDDLVAA